MRDSYDVEVSGVAHPLGDGQQLTGVLEEALTSLGESDVAAVADQQRLTDDALELADLLGERGLADVELGRRPAEVQLVGDDDEVPDQT